MANAINNDDDITLFPWTFRLNSSSSSSIRTSNKVSLPLGTRWRRSKRGTGQVQGNATALNVNSGSDSTDGLGPPLCGAARIACALVPPKPKDDKPTFLELKACEEDGTTRKSFKSR
eukprot:Skav220845  [mRNA]  locus=scaffold1888:397052:400831:+ [translate_table: standard]